MSQRMTRTWIAAACVMGGLLSPAPAECATLLQWMFPRLAARRSAQIGAYPVTAGYAPAAAGYARTTAGYAPTTAYYGGTGGCSTCSSPQTGWYYRPQTAYRTVWSQVPVTSYRPTPGIYNGLQAGTTNYDWQARRVPYVSYRPIFAGFRNRRAYSALYGSRASNVLVPNGGNYWTQFGSAGYSLPRSQGLARTQVAAPTYGGGFSTPADIAPVLTGPVTPAPTTAFSIPTYPTTTYSYPTTTAGYPSAWEPVTTTNRQVSGATPWQPVEAARPDTSSTAPSNAYSYSQGGFDRSTSLSVDSSAGGATPWMPVEEYNRTQRLDSSDDRFSPSDRRQLQDVPANRRPQLEDDSYQSSDRRGSWGQPNRSASDRANRDADQDARWRAYDRYGYGGESARNSDPAYGVKLDRYRPAQPEVQAVPYFRPIPDDDRNDRFGDRSETGNDNRGDGELRLLGAEQITAALDQAASRWIAEPLRSNKNDRPLRTQVLRPETRDEGGWRQAR